MTKVLTVYSVILIIVFSMQANAATMPLLQNMTAHACVAGEKCIDKHIHASSDFSNARDLKSEKMLSLNFQDIKVTERFKIS